MSSGNMDVDVDVDKYSMFMYTGQASIIRTLSESLKEVLTDVDITFDETGFSINTVDKSEVAFIHMKLDAKKFETYSCPKTVTCGINMLSLHRLLKKINNADQITMYVEKVNNQFLFIKIENQDKKIKSLSKIKTIDVTSKKVSIPEITFDYSRSIKCSDFQKICRDLLLLSKIVKIYSNGKMLRLEVSGTYADQTYDIGYSNNSIACNEDSIQYIGEYQLDFLSLFCKSSSLCEQVDIFLKPNYPVVLSYAVGQLGTIKFGLSPL